MTAAVVAPLYHSPQGLYPFQAEGVAYCCLRPSNLVVYDTGTGKGHVAMATSAVLFEDGLIDLVLIVCEKNKIDEWMEDFKRFTSLKARLYRGSKTTRERIRQALGDGGDEQVWVTTYETARSDLAVFDRRNKRRAPEHGPLLRLLLDSGLRVLVVYDEITKLKGRSSQNHRAHELLVRELRQRNRVRVMGLTATPMERNEEDYYNLGRILTPTTMGTVAQFDQEHVLAKDIFGTPTRFKNITDADCEPGVVSLMAKMAPVLLRKRKTDPDVLEQFPKKVEEFSYVDLGRNHIDFMRAVEDTFSTGQEVLDRRLFVLLRQIAGHPMSLLRSNGEVARKVVETVGEEGLHRLGSAKADRLVEYLLPLVKGQGAQVVVFTFFGRSVLPLLAQRLETEGFSVVVNHGGLSDRQREEARARFREGVEVFLTSDAGSRGLNLQSASYVCHYELPLTYALYTQRSDRIHRIDSSHPSVTVQSFIARNCVEEGVARLVLNRNTRQETLLGDAEGAGEGYLASADRRMLLRLAKEALPVASPAS